MDWFTLTAQVINFLVLVGLLKYFLYGPIIRAMEEREAKIAHRLEDAARQRTEADRQAKEYEQQIREFEVQRAQLMSEAKEGADDQRRQLLDQARQEADSLRHSWQKSLQHEQHSFTSDLREKTARRIVAIARRALRDLAGMELEAAILARFTERLEAMPQDQLDSLATSLAETRHELVVHTTFEIPERRRGPLIEVVQGLVPNEASVRLETSNELICGIEIRTSSYRIGWSVRDYLDNLEADFLESLEGLNDDGSQR